MIIRKRTTSILKFFFDHELNELNEFFEPQRLCPADSQDRVADHGAAKLALLS